VGELRVISAGAGTGKTHRLAHELVEALIDTSDGRAPIAPEAVVAVTYTRSAAAELEGRVRTALIERGFADLARRLAGARIGTVHSVCARLVDEHAFALGLAPDLRTLDDSAARAVFEDALAASITDAERRQLDELEQRVNLGDDASIFYGHVRAICDRARANDLDDDDLALSCAESIASLVANLPPAVPGADLERQLLAAIDETLPNFVGKRWSPALTDEVDKAQRAAAQLRRGAPLRWSEWQTIEGFSSFKNAAKVAMRHAEHDGLVGDLTALITLAFSIARRAMQRYDDDKRAAGVIDFGDQEHLALQVVENAAIAATLGADIQLLLVDEFQDTSPLQLRLFRALKEVARRTVVVGDEKQSIFGFRDANPALFSEFAKESDALSRLDVSHRSRPGLVRAVSAVFAQAFSSTLRAADVELTPVVDDDPPELGAHVERWWVDSSPDEARVEEEAMVAAGIVELLSTREAWVRSSVGIRPAVSRDIAVLVKTNAGCRAMAQALNARGVPVLLRQKGLSKTWEARVMAAALALWLDGNDLLARATLVHLLDDEAAARGLEAPSILAPIVDAKKGEAFATHPLVTAVVAAAIADRHAGLVRAFDRIVDVLRLDDRLNRLDDTAQRRADLAALRALAVRFVDECFARGRGPTVAGFVGRLEALQQARFDEDDPDDQRGDIAGKDAVEIVTWHKAKGREWPIVVLAGALWKDLWLRPFDVAVETELTLPRMDSPTTKRWLRLWPSPYGQGADQRRALFRAVERSPPVERLRVRDHDENRRLLYVGFTRPRDRLVVVGDQTVWAKGMLSTLVSSDKRPYCSDPPGQAGAARWAGVDVQMVVHQPRMSATLHEHRAELVLPPLPAVDVSVDVRAPRYVQPSAQEGEGTTGEIVTLGAKIPLKEAFATFESLNHLGQCVHAFLAWDAFVDVADHDRRFLKAKAMRERFEVVDMVEVSTLVAMGTRLWAALDARFPGHRRRTEVPMQHRLSTGSVVRGQIDLLLDLPDGSAVIVDHKTIQHTDIGGYAGQLVAYANAVADSGVNSNPWRPAKGLNVLMNSTASGRKTVTTWIHAPLQAQLVEVHAVVT
jgi:ATP-dependent helicase/nuclease subunit A